MRIIILAAGLGSRLPASMRDKPKCLVEADGRPLLYRQLTAARAGGITETTLCGGYRVDLLAPFASDIVINARYHSTNMVETMFAAQHRFGEQFVMAYGDIAYRPMVMRRLLSVDADVAVVVDRDWYAYWKMRYADPLSDAETLRFGHDGRIVRIGQKTDRLEDVQAQYIGLVKFQQRGIEAITQLRHEAMSEFAKAGTTFGRRKQPETMFMTDILQALADSGVRLQPVVIDGGWIEIDTMDDLRVATELIQQGRLDDPS